MGLVVETKWDFECVNCPKYVKPEMERKMGFCPIKDKKVSKKFTCKENPLHIRFWFYYHGIPLDTINSASDEELKEIMNKVKAQVSEQ